ARKKHCFNASLRAGLNALAIAKHEGSQNDEVFRVPKPRTISIAAYAEDEDKSESIVIKDESGLNGSASKDRQANTRYRKSTNESSQAENFVTKDHDGDSHGTRLKEHRGSNVRLFSLSLGFCFIFHGPILFALLGEIFSLLRCCLSA
ncbi:hypothetical protein S83_004855, partial [Arachis hypogaea]